VIPDLEDVQDEDMMTQIAAPPRLFTTIIIVVQIIFLPYFLTLDP